MHTTLCAGGLINEIKKFKIKLSLSIIYVQYRFRYRFYIMTQQFVTPYLYNFFKFKLIRP